MGHTIVHYQDNNKSAWGLVAQDRVFTIPGNYSTLAQLLEAGTEVLTDIDSSISKALADLQLLSPVTPDAKLICQGLNYAEHQDEAGHGQGHSHGNEDDDFLHFAKDSTSLCGPYDAIIRPADCKLLDYEAELGLVISTNINQDSNIDSENLGEFIAGMVICNDVSARDIMFGTSFLQWFKGKSQRTFCPTGPFFYWLAPGEIDVIFNLDLTLKVNSEIRQHANTSQLIHRPEKVLSELSQQIDFKPGDLLLTGTPGGVIAQNTPGSFKALTTLLINDKERRAAFTQDQLEHNRFLEPGDKVSISIASPCGEIDLGEQINVVQDKNVS